MANGLWRWVLCAGLLIQLALPAAAQQPASAAETATQSQSPAAPQAATEQQPAPAAAEQAAPAAPRMQAYMVEMRDGVHLATDVYFPEGDGPWPVILMRTPYDKTQAAGYAVKTTSNGFALAAQDMRGRYMSEGENLPFLACGWGAQQDGYDTIAWLVAQDFCDGKVGTYGGSALGITQNLMAPTQPPGLVCQHIGVATSSLYHQAAYPGGALRQAQVQGWLEGTGFDPEALELYRAHPLYDDFWRQFNIAERIGDIVTPALHFGGWFDTFSQGTLDSYMLRQHQGGAGARGNQWLVMGPWTHSGRGGVECGEVQFPDNARDVPVDALELWFGYWLKDTALDITKLPHVAYYVVGDLDDPDAPGNEWRFADDWPVAASDTAYYLTPDGGLSLEPASEGGRVAFTADPGQPVSTIGGRNLVLDPGIYDQRPIEQRYDVLEFDTPVLSAPLEVTGRLLCTLWASCDAIDTDIAVRLCDVYPDGRSLLIADGIRRLSVSDDFERRVPLTPGEIYQVTVDLWSTSIIFNAGHRIRLSVCGSNYPRWDLNPGTGAVWEDGCDYVAQHTTLYLDAAHPSHLQLPVVE